MRLGRFRDWVTPSEATAASERLSTLVRWAVLVLVLVVNNFTRLYYGKTVGQVNRVALVLGLANLALSVILWWRPRFPRAASLLVSLLDVAFISVLVALAPQIRSTPYDFIYALIILLAAVRFGLGVSILFSIIISVTYTLIVFGQPHAFATEDLRNAMVVTRTLTFLGIGIVGGILAHLEQTQRRRREAEHRRSRELEVVQRVGGAISTTLELHELMERAFSSLQEVIPFTHGEITLWEGQEGCLVSYSHYLPQGYEVRELRYSLGEGYSGWMAVRREPLWLPDVSAETELRPKDEEIPMVSYLGVPLLVGDRLVGTLELSSLEKGTFDREDLELLVATAPQIAAMLDHARLYDRVRQRLERRVQQLSAIESIDRELSGTLDLESLIEGILERAIEFTGADSGALLSMSEQQDELLLMATHGWRDELREEHGAKRWPLDEGVVGRVARTQKPALIEDASQDPDYYDATGKTVAELAVPISLEDEVLGVLNLESQQPARFDEEDLEFVQHLAEHVAIAMQNARLFSREQRRARELATLHEIALDISGELALDRLLEAVIQRALDLLDREAGSLWLYEADDGLLRCVATIADWRESPEMVLRPGQGLSGYVYSNGEPLVVDDYRTWVGAVHDDPIGPAVGVPLSWKGEVRGVLAVLGRPGSPVFSEDDVSAISLLAAQATIAIENALLFEETRRWAEQMNLLQQVDRTLASALSIQDTMEALIKGVQRLIPHSGGEICLYDPGRKVLVAESILGEAARVASAAIYSLEEGYSGWIARHREPLLIEDCAAFSDVRPKQESVVTKGQLRSFLGVPMMVGERLIGTLELISDERGTFNQEHRRLLTMVASQAAVSIDNARLYELTERRLRQRIDQLLALQRIGQEMNSTLDLDHNLGAIVEDAIQVSPATHGNIAMYDEAAGGFRVTSAHVGYSTEEVRLLRQLRMGQGQSIVDDVIRSGQAQVVADAHAESRPICVRREARSALSVPIHYEGRVVGVINLRSTEVDAFQEETLQFAQTLASQASLSVGNARRYAELVQQRELVSKRATQLREILEIGNTLRADQKLDDILSQIAYGVMGSVGFGTVLFSLVSESDSERMERVASAGIPLEDFRRMQQDRPTVQSYLDLFQQEYRISRSYFVPQEAGRTQNDGQIYVFPDMGIEEELAADEWHPHDLLLVPLYNGAGQLIGTMSVDNPFDRRRPDRRTVEALEIFANQAAVAVENARLFRERERRITELNLLNRVSQATTSTLDLDTILLAIYEQLAAAGTIEVEGFYIAIHDPERDLLRFYPIVDRGVIYDANERPPQGMAGWILEHRQPLLVREIEQAVEEGLVERIHLAGWQGERPRSYLGVPLMVGEDMIGVIGAQSYQPGAYGEREKEFLLTVANQVAVAIESARLFREREQRLAELAILNEISQALSSALELDELARVVNEQVSRVFDTTNFYIALYEEETDEWETIFETEEGELRPPERYKVGAGLTGHIIRNKRPLLFNRTEQIEAFHDQEGISYLGRPALSWLGVPLIAADKVVGVMAIQSYQEERLYDEQDLALFSTIAAQAGIAIDNARLFQERERRITELAILNEVGRVISSALELDELLEAVHEQVSRVFDVTNFYIALYDQETDQWAAPFHLEHGERQPVVWRKVAAGLTGYIIRNREPVLLRNVEENTQFHEEQEIPMVGDLAKSWLGVPLIAADKLVGVMGIQSYEREYIYDQEDQSLFSTIGAQAAIAIDNARLFQERERRITELAILNEIGRALSSALESEQVMQAIYEQVGRVLDTSNFYVALHHEEDQEWETVLDIYHDERRPSERHGVDAGLTGYIIRNREPLLFRTEEELLDFHDEQGFTAVGEQAKSWVGVPMIAADRVVGVIGVESYDREYAFAEDDRAVLSTVAAQAAVALQNALLFEETHQRLQQVNALLEVSRDVATRLDLSSLLQSILEAAVRSVPAADRGSILLLDQEAQDLVVAAQIGYPESDRERDEIRLGLDEGFAGWVCREGRADVVVDAQNDPRFMVTDSTRQVQSIMSAPLIGRRGLVGVVNLDNLERKGAFGGQHLEFLSGLAHQAAVAIENARLFEDRERQARVLESRVRELSALLEGTRAITSTLQLREVLETLVGVVSRQMDVTTVALWLVEHGEIAPAAALGLPDEFMAQVRMPVGEGLSGHVAASGEVLALSDVIQVPDEEHSPHYSAMDEELGLHAYLGVPVAYQQRVLGVLSVMDQEIRDFAPEEVALLTGLAEQVGIAVENARLFQEREKRITELSALNEVGRAISSTMRLDDLLETIRREAGRLVDTDNFLVALYDRRENEVSFPVYHEFGERLETPSRQAGNGLTEYVIQQRAPVLIDGDTAAFCEEHGVDHVGMAAKSWLGVPMIYMDEVIGIVALQDYEHVGAYDEHHVRLLSTIASTAAVAIQNARLFTDLEASRTELETRLIQLGALQEMGQTISGTLELDAVVDTVLEAVTFTVGFSYAVISLVDEEANEVRAVGGVGVSDEQIVQSRQSLDSDDIMADIVRTGKTEVIDGWDDRLDRALFEKFDHAGLVRIYAPLVARGKAIGLIEAGYPKELRSTITRDDIEVLQTFLAQASIAVDNARLFAEIRRFTEELEEMVEARTQQLQDEKNRLEALHTITTELSSTLDLDEILLKTIDMASMATGRSLGMVLLRDPSGGGLICRAMLDEGYALRPGGQVYSLSEVGALRYVMDEREPLSIDDVEEDPRWEELPELPSGARSVAVVPLVSAEEVVGVILLTHSQVGFFDEEQMRLLQTLGGEVAAAIHNAELYGYINEQALRLAEMLQSQQEEASKVRAILQSIADGVIVVDREDTIIVANPAAEQILDMSKEELEGRTTAELPGLFSTGGLFAQDSRHYELMERFINVHSSPVVTNTGAVLGTVYVLRDITREVEADRAKTEFISTVSHELRTPLTSIKGYVDLILLGSVGEISPMQKNFLDVVRANANRLVDLINDLLDISRIETGRIVINPEPISVRDLVEEVLASARMEVERKQLAVEVDVSPELPLVRADRKRVVQVLSNLVSNAYKYTREGGEIAVGAHCTDGFLQIDVRDTGVGISEEDQEKLFTRFFRADSPLRDEVGGTGLGLAISKSFIELLGGEMWVESEIDEGSTFSFTLPLASKALEEERSASQKADEDQDADAAASTPRHVLVVDDEPHIGDLLRYQLERNGYLVSTARRGEAALEIARREHPDLITLDILMAGMDGFEVLEQLKEDDETADIPVVIISIVAEKEDLMAMGAVDFLPKPLEEESLQRVVRDVLASVEDLRTVLVGDDDPDIVGWLRRVLEEEGFQVNMAYDGEEALAAVQEEAPDLILLDMRMPKLDGREVIQRLKLDEETRDIAIIVITASSVDKERDRVQMLGLGAESFLTKPFTAEELVREIERAFKERMEAAKE